MSKFFRFRVLPKLASDPVIMHELSRKYLIYRYRSVIERWNETPVRFSIWAFSLTGLQKKIGAHSKLTNRDRQIAIKLLILWP